MTGLKHRGLCGLRITTGITVTFSPVYLFFFYFFVVNHLGHLDRLVFPAVPGWRQLLAAVMTHLEPLEPPGFGSAGD